MANNLLTKKILVGLTATAGAMTVLVLRKRILAFLKKYKRAKDDQFIKNQPWFDKAFAHIAQLEHLVRNRDNMLHTEKTAAIFKLTQIRLNLKNIMDQEKKYNKDIGKQKKMFF